MGVKRKLIGIVGALVFALAGTFLVLNAKAKQGDQAVTRQQVPMLAAAQALSAGTSVDKLLNNPTMVSVQMVNIEDKNVDALVDVASLDKYKGLVLNADVAPGGPLLTSSFVDRASLSLAAGGVEVPADLLQVSFSLEPQRVLGGALRPGDRVAVVMSYTGNNAAGQAVAQSHIILQKALVANVQLANLANAEDAGTAGGAPTVVGNYMVTLAVSPGDTERLTNALEFGKLWIAKQPDAANGETKVWDVPMSLSDPVTSYKAADQ